MGFMTIWTVCSMGQTAILEVMVKNRPSLLRVRQLVYRFMVSAPTVGE